MGTCICEESSVKPLNNAAATSGEKLCGGGRHTKLLLEVSILLSFRFPLPSAPSLHAFMVVTRTSRVKGPGGNDQ